MTNLKLASSAAPRFISKTPLSKEYTECVNEAKHILNHSKIERYRLLININNHGETLTDKQQAMLTRIVNFSNKGSKIICYNGSIIYSPEFMIKQHNANFVDEVNQYFTERSTAKKVDDMLKWAGKPLT